MLLRRPFALPHLPPARLPARPRALLLQFVGRFFKLKARQTTFTRELMGGLTTFLTIAYILAGEAGEALGRLTAQ